LLSSGAVGMVLSSLLSTFVEGTTGDNTGDTTSLSTAAVSSFSFSSFVVDEFSPTGAVEVEVGLVVEDGR